MPNLFVFIVSPTAVNVSAITNTSRRFLIQRLTHRTYSLENKRENVLWIYCGRHWVYKNFRLWGFLAFFWISFFASHLAVHKKIVKHYHNQSMRESLWRFVFYRNIVVFAFSRFFFVVTQSWTWRDVAEDTILWHSISFYNEATAFGYHAMVHHAHTCLNQFPVLHDTCHFSFPS